MCKWRTPGKLSSHNGIKMSLQSEKQNILLIYKLLNEAAPTCMSQIYSPEKKYPFFTNPLNRPIMDGFKSLRCVQKLLDERNKFFM